MTAMGNGNVGAGKNGNEPAASRESNPHHFNRAIERTVAGAVLCAADPTRRRLLAQLGAAALTAFIAYLVMLIWPMIAFGWVTNMLQRGMASWKRMLEVMDTVPLVSDGPGAAGTKLAAAYGIAVTLDMTITTVMTFFVIRYGWKYPLALCVAATGFFFVVDIVFFAANAVKVLEGGWFPLLIGAGMFLLMFTWKQGRRILAAGLTPTHIDTHKHTHLAPPVLRAVARLDALWRPFKAVATVFLFLLNEGGSRTTTSNRCPLAAAPVSS